MAIVNWSSEWREVYAETLPIGSLVLIVEDSGNVPSIVGPESTLR